MKDIEISLEKITKKLESGRILFDNINFTFSSGNFYLIKGRSGSGKTTLLTVISGLEKPTSGEVLYKGFSKKDSLFSFYFTDANAFEFMSVRSNLEVVCHSEKRIEEVTKKLNIFSLLDKPVQDCSKGEQARVGLARLILENKPIVLLDEPTANLDESTSKLVFDVLHEELKGKLVICVSHDIEALDWACVIELKDHNLKLVHSGVIEKEEIEVKKPNTFLSLKTIWLCLKHILKTSPVKASLVFIFSIVFFYVASLQTSVFSSNDVYLRNLELSQSTYAYCSNPKGSKIYQQFNTPFGSFNYTYLVSEDNRFITNEKTVNLSEKEIVAGEFAYLNIESALKEEGITDIKLTYDSSLDLASYAYASMDIFKEYMPSSYGLKASQILTPSTFSKESLDAIFESVYTNYSLLTGDKNLSGYQVGLYYDKVRLEQSLSIKDIEKIESLFGETFSTKGTIFENYFDSFELVKLEKDTHIFSAEFVVSEEIAATLKGDSFNFYQKVSNNPALVSNVDFTSKLAKYLTPFDSKTTSSLPSSIDNLIVNIDILMYLTLGFFACIAVFIVFIVNSTDKSFKESKNYIRTISYKFFNTGLIYFLALLIPIAAGLIVGFSLFAITSNLVLTELSYIYSSSSFGIGSLAFPIYWLIGLLGVLLVVSLLFALGKKNYNEEIKIDRL